MDLGAILPFVIAFASLAGFELGTRVREHVHVIMPYKDPVTLAIVLSALSPVILDYSGHRVVDPGDVWYLSFLIAFLGCYTLSYIRGEFDLVYVNVHTIVSEKFPGGAQEVKPVVYYWDRDGNQCLQEQSFKEILKTVVFGVRSPLRLDIGMVKRTRPIFVSKVLFPMVAVDAIDVVEEKVEESETTRWRFRFKVRSYTYTPAPSCIDTTQQWLVSAYNQKYLAEEVARKEGQLLEAKTSAMSSFYARSGDLLVEMVADRTPGTEVYKDVASRLAPPEREVRVPDIEEAPPDLAGGPRAKRSLFKRKRDAEERRDGGDGERSDRNGRGAHLAPRPQHVRGHPLRARVLLGEERDVGVGRDRGVPSEEGRLAGEPDHGPPVGLRGP